MIKKCTCEHKDQDSMHGKGMRVHTPINNKTNPNDWRCTICKSER
jgi:hypothetical protein